MSPVVLIFPHSPKVYASASDLASWLWNALRVDGGYLVAGRSAGYAKVEAGTLVLFQKDKQIVGEAIARSGCQPYTGSEVSPATGKAYTREILFEPTSVRCYKNPISLTDASKLTGKRLFPRFVQQLEWSQYAALMPELVKEGFY